MISYTLDASIIIELITGNQKVRDRVVEAIIRGDRILIDGISYYEVKRGLFEAGAQGQLKRFNLFCDGHDLTYFDNKDVFEIAAEVYFNLKSNGQLIDDADILIASLAKQHNSTVVSANTRHFERISGLSVENWMN